MWPCLLDTAFTLLRRLVRRQNVFRAHRTHVYQRLVIAGSTHRQITIVYLAMALLGIPAALGIAQQRSVLASFGLAAIALAAGAVYVWTVWCERTTVRSSASREDSYVNPSR